MRIAFIYLGGRLRREEQFGSFPSEFFLGARELSARGHDVKLLEADEVASRNLLTMLLSRTVSKALLPAKTYIGLYGSIELLLPALVDREVIVATSSGLAFSLAFWSWRRRLPFAVVGIQCGITHYRIGWWSRTSSRFLFRRMHTQLYSATELDWMKSFFDIPDDRIEFNPFGVDTAFWSPVEPGTPPRGGAAAPYVLAVGNDAQRDFETLIEAARGAAWRLILLTQRVLPPELPDNVENIRGSYAEGISDLALRDLYRNACCVVVPLQPGLQPSGQSVALQAMSCGTPVVLTRTAGLFDAAGLRDGVELLLVEPAHPAALRSAVERLLTTPALRQSLSAAGRAYVLQHGRIESYADRLERLCERVSSSAGSQ